MESIDAFCSYMLEKAAKNQGKKRENILELIKEIRPHFDAYITELLQDD